MRGFPKKVLRGKKRGDVQQNINVSKGGKENFKIKVLKTI